MLEQQKITFLMDKVKDIFENEFSGHDYFHTERVYNMAIRIAKEEKADLTIVQLASLLHDVDDYKVFGGEIGQCNNAVMLMQSIGIGEEIQAQVCKIINTMSFHVKGTKESMSLEGKVVQDADRLDAIGAIGIARAFAYGGNHHRIMHDPESKPKLDMSTDEYIANKGTTIDHFYEKLLLLKELMNTESAKRIAEKRHAYMQAYLEEFYGEWAGEK